MVRSEKKTLSTAGARRRSELMAAAVDLAAEHGFRATRVSDIVGRVGVGQGVFYWYFESKDALFQEIFRDNVLRLRRYQAAVIAGETDPVRRIARGIVATMDFIVRNRHVFALLDHAAGDRFQQQRSENRRTHVLDMVRHIEEAMDGGLVPRRDPELLAQAIAGVVDRLARVYLGAEIRRPVDDVAQAAVDFCIGGLLGVGALPVSELRAAMPDTYDDLRDRVGAGR